MKKNRKINVVATPSKDTKIVVENVTKPEVTKGQGEFSLEDLKNSQLTQDAIFDNVQFNAIKIMVDATTIYDFIMCDELYDNLISQNDLNTFKVLKTEMLVRVADISIRNFSKYSSTQNMYKCSCVVNDVVHVVTVKRDGMKLYISVPESPIYTVKTIQYVRKLI